MKRNKKKDYRLVKQLNSFRELNEIKTFLPVSQGLKCPTHLRETLPTPNLKFVILLCYKNSNFNCQEPDS